MKKTVLITGAFGFIGKYVTKRLLMLNYHIIALTHTRRPEQQDNVEVIEVDITDRNMISELFQQIKHCDMIVHLAASLNMDAGDEIISVNCHGTYHLIQLASLLEVQKFIYISSIPVIGTPKIIPITEEHPVCPESLYHISKYTGEQMVSTLCSDYIKKIILRIPSPIGIGMNPNNFLSVLFGRCLKNENIELFGQGLRIQNYIDVRDIAEAVNQAIEYQGSDLFLVAGKRSFSNRELAFLCKEITHSSSNISWGKKNDPEEQRQWIISTKKIEHNLHFVPKYNLNDTLEWIYEYKIGCR